VPEAAVRFEVALLHDVHAWKQGKQSIVSSFLWKYSSKCNLLMHDWLTSE
jgi:hypothetical protein